MNLKWLALWCFVGLVLWAGIIWSVHELYGLMFG